MSLMRSLVSAFAPGARSPGARTFRELARETAAYRGALPGYRPYLGDHEPPDRIATEKRARLVYDMTLAAEAERTTEISALLGRDGLDVAPTVAAWDAIGDWVMERIEGSREPGSARHAPFIHDRVGDPPPKHVNGESTTEVRPLWRSVAFDLSLLLGRRMIDAQPGGRWVRDGELKGREGSVLAAPLVTHDGRRAQQPFGFVTGFMGHALALKLRVAQEPNMRLGDALRRLAEAAADGVEEPTPEEEFIGELEEMLGMGPIGEEDVAEMLKAHGLARMPDLPPRLAEALAARPRR